MPEIGECYTIAEKLNESKDTIVKVKTSKNFNTHILKTPLFNIRSLSEMKIHEVFAYGKSVWFELVNDTQRVVIVSQLGMTGSWFIDHHGRDVKNDHFVLEGKKHTFRYSDPRMFGKMRFFGFKKTEENWKELVLENFSFGIDPMDLTANQLAKKLEESWKKKDKEIKILMLEQNVIFGIGNYLASEILYAAKVHPQSRAKNLDTEDFKNIAKETLRICSLAIKTGGHSFAEGFYHPDGSTGKMSKYIKVYGREGFNCENGHRIEKIDQLGRSTFFCPRCQIKK